MQLVRYEAAVFALAECKAVDEVKAWADKAAAMQAYGRMAKNKRLEVDAAEIRIRAERKLGELLASHKAQGDMAKGIRGRFAEGNSRALQDEEGPRLADAGISYNLSSRAQAMAAVPEQQFEEAITDWRHRVEAEGARVSHRLQKAGQKTLRERASKPVELEPEAVTVEEAAYLERKAAEFELRLQALLDADDKLAEAVQMARQAQSLADALQFRIDGLRNENAELVREVKYWRKKAEAGKIRAEEAK